MLDGFRVKVSLKVITVWSGTVAELPGHFVLPDFAVLQQ